MYMLGPTTTVESSSLNSRSQTAKKIHELSKFNIHDENMTWRACFMVHWLRHWKNGKPLVCQTQLLLCCILYSKLGGIFQVQFPEECLPFSSPLPPLFPPFSSFFFFSSIFCQLLGRIWASRLSTRNSSIQTWLCTGWRKIHVCNSRERKTHMQLL